MAQQARPDGSFVSHLWPAGNSAAQVRRKVARLILAPTAGMDTAQTRGMNMNELDGQMELRDTAIALFLEENDLDQITDILVAALDDALRLMAEEIAQDTVH